MKQIHGDGLAFETSPPLQDAVYWCVLVLGGWIRLGPNTQMLLTLKYNGDKMEDKGEEEDEDNSLSKIREVIQTKN